MAKEIISVVDYGMGNIGSISNMLKKIGVASTIISNPNLLNQAQKIILPGVGSFDNAMTKLNNSGFSDAIIRSANDGVPILGICLGMQLLSTNSEEGVLPGLNLVPGQTKKFQSTNNLRVPHMGWNIVNVRDKQVYDGLDENKFYFVHSYYFNPANPDHIIGMTNYGIEFCSSVRKENIFGVQFHPEKSHKFGMQFLRNFNRIKP